MEKESKSKNLIIVLLIILIVLLVIGIVIGVLILSKNENQLSNGNSIVEENNVNTSINEENDENEEITSSDTKNTISKKSKNSETSNTDEDTTSNSTEENDTDVSHSNTDNNNNNNSDIKIVNVKGKEISVPATKESFDGTGWEWNPKYANTDLATGYTTSGGRVGNSPGGAVVNVINKSGQTQKIQDCIIDFITFYNPGDGSEDVSFIGGLNYDSTIDEVKAKFSELGYSNVKERSLENSDYLTYYLDDDSSNYKDYIEFYFFKDTIKSVTVSSSVK